MENDTGIKKFFCYISFFTFAMLMLVGANNFLQLFFGWEAVGLASYLLIGFWHQKESAIFANLKAFLVNRIGDFGFLLGIVMIFFYFKTLNYIDVFKQVGFIAKQDMTLSIFTGFHWSVITVICICLFIGAMGKSAQIPLHVWLPDSMEGPTPISALIHAATMVTAGIFMVSRFSPLFEYSSEFVLNFIMLIGSITCLLMGFLGVVQKDIKRIIAYSTLSQLGLMVAGLGASSYSLSMLHLINHAFFKALLFLCAGSVITALHHEQDIRRMGSLCKKMPVTYITMLIGSFSLIGFPGLSGFFSKDLLIDCVKHSVLETSYLCYILVLSSVFFTALYSFRLIFIVFHKTIFTTNMIHDHVHESSFVITVPLVFLSIFSIFSGWLFTDSIIYNYFYKDIFMLSQHGGLSVVTQHYTGVFQLFVHGFTTLPFMLAMTGILFSWVFYVKKPEFVMYLTQKLPFTRLVYNIMVNAYGFDVFNKVVLVWFVKTIGLFFYKYIDQMLIDTFFVNGSGNFLIMISKSVRKLQTGFLYHYITFIMIGFVLMVLSLFGIINVFF
jgi:NADH-quinone oxidoreductase subunit L